MVIHVQKVHNCFITEVFATICPPYECCDYSGHKLPLENVTMAYVYTHTGKQLPLGQLLEISNDQQFT